MGICRPHPFQGNSWTSVWCLLLWPLLLCWIILLLRSGSVNRTLLSDTPLLKAVESITKPMSPGFLRCYMLEVGKVPLFFLFFKVVSQASPWCVELQLSCPTVAVFIRPCFIIYRNEMSWMDRVILFVISCLLRHYTARLISFLVTGGTWPLFSVVSWSFNQLLHKSVLCFFCFVYIHNTWMRIWFGEVSRQKEVSSPFPQWNESEFTVSHFG